MPSTEALYLVLLIVCLLFSFFFSASETAFISLQKVRLEHLVSTGAASAKRVARMLEHPEKLLSTVLLGNTFVNIAAAALATALAIPRWPDYGILVATIGVTVILLIFVEATPKTIAAHHAERLSLTFVRPLELISWLFTPFVFILSWVTSRLCRLLGGDTLPKSLATKEQIRHMIAVGHKEGTVEEDEARMLHRVFDFGDRPVREVMVPRPDVVAIEQGATTADFLALFASSPLSRFPVYRENMDSVVAVLSVKDVLMGLARGKYGKETPINEFVRPAYFTPETKPINELFAEMRDSNCRMAIVIDEFGGTAGIVSLNRLVEEIVGPVGDELTAAENDYEIINAHTFQIDGGMRIEDINAEMALGLPESEDYQTISGFILSQLGRIPREGEQTRYKDVKILITRMSGMKIEEVLLTREKPIQNGKDRDSLRQNG